jgi:hypothetical protein
MLVRLKVKLAERVNGLDLTHCVEGDVIDVVDQDGRMLIAEGWAEAANEADAVSCEPRRLERAVAADEGYRGWRKAPGRVNE